MWSACGRRKERVSTRLAWGEGGGGKEDELLRFWLCFEVRALFQISTNQYKLRRSFKNSVKTVSKLQF